MCHRTCSSPKIPLRRLPEDVHMAAGSCVLRPALFVPAPGPPSPRAVTLDASPRCRRWWQSIAPLLLTLKPLQLHHHAPAFLSAAEGGRRQQKAGGKLQPGVRLVQTNSPSSFTSQFAFDMKCIRVLPSSFWHAHARTHRPTFGHRTKQETRKLLCGVSFKAMC